MYDPLTCYVSSKNERNCTTESRLLLKTFFTIYHIKKIMGGPGGVSKFEKNYFEYFFINSIPNGKTNPPRGLTFAQKPHFEPP